ncbi:DNA-binding domain-containing protein [Sulfitobacter sp. HNIBRBA3233]|uniref:DNA-binding domain-containing protein n=1 Tax=Sulfitobacter marinivivus TaxID=3158558 RepID=UPI0032DF976D
MTVSQSEFRAALLDAGRPAPRGLSGPDGAQAGRRYDVYRNNVTVSLIEAMKTAFPLVRGLLGAQNFDTLVPLYVRAHPPRSPLMMHYGAEFPEFLDGVAQLRHLGYLGDVARLDLALREAYHAADARPFDASVLQRPPEQLAHVRLTLAPATRIIRSRWPLFDLWRRARSTDAPKPRPQGQSVLVTRPEYDPEVHLLQESSAVWLSSLHDLPLGEAVERAEKQHPDFDFTQSLSLALQSHAFTSE